MPFSFLTHDPRPHYSLLLQSKLEYLRIRCNEPILCYIEKITLLIDYFQMFDLLWVAAQPWPWPYIWSTYNRPLLYLNLDIFSTTSNGAITGKTGYISSQSLWGMMDGYIYYALYFAIASFILFILTYFLDHAWYFYGRKTSFLNHKLSSIALYLSYITYLPCNLAVFRLYYCDPSTNHLSADPNVSCESSNYIIITAISTMLILPTLFGLPWLLYTIPKSNLIYSDSNDHEKRLQLWEILYMLDLDSYWLKEKLWIISSFRRDAVYFRLHSILFKLGLLLLFIFCRTDFILQSILINVLILLYSFYYSILYLPFRSQPTNMMFLLTMSMQIVNGLFGMANAFNVQNVIVVTSTETLILGSYNGFCWVLIIFILILVSVQPVLDWPSLRTLDRIQKSKSLLCKATVWIETMRDANAVKMDFLLSPIEVADIDSLEDAIRALRQCWLSAKSCGSIFETALSDFMEELLYIHAIRKPNAIRRIPHWNEAFQETVQNQTFVKYDRTHHMMSPRKRRILLKLLAYRFILGHRKKKFDMVIANISTRNSQTERKPHHHVPQKAKFGFKLFGLNANRILARTMNGETDHPHGEKSRHERRKSLKNEIELENQIEKILREELEIERLEQQQHRHRHRHHGDIEQGVEVVNYEGNPAAEGQGEKVDDVEESEEDDEEDDDEDEFDHTGQLFSRNDIAEAEEMILRLKERTEVAIKRYNMQYLQNILNQAMKESHLPTNDSDPNSMPSPAPLLPLNHPLTTTLSGDGQISTSHHSIELLRGVIDEEEQNDLEELYLLWDEAIQLYEIEQFPADYEKLHKIVENWYTYRGLLSERLELVMKILDENNFEYEEYAEEETMERGGVSQNQPLRVDTSEGGESMKRSGMPDSSKSPMKAEIIRRIASIDRLKSRESSANLLIHQNSASSLTPYRSPIHSSAQMNSPKSRPLPPNSLPPTMRPYGSSYNESSITPTDQYNPLSPQPLSGGSNSASLSKLHNTSNSSVGMDNYNASRRDLRSLSRDNPSVNTSWHNLRKHSQMSLSKLAASSRSTSDHQNVGNNFSGLNSRRQISDTAVNMDSTTLSPFNFEGIDEQESVGGSSGKQHVPQNEEIKKTK